MHVSIAGDRSPGLASAAIASLKSMEAASLAPLTMPVMVYHLHHYSEKEPMSEEEQQARKNRRKLAGIDIEQEYQNILQKKSTLSASMRRLVLQARG